MAELRYVDWDGLVYYDGKVKDFINDKFGDVLKVGGMIEFKDLPCPSFENLNYLYKISDDFTSNEYFYKPGYVYKSGTIVQVSNLNNVYLYTIFSEVNNNSSNIPDIPEDFSELLEKVDDLDSAVALNTQLITSIENNQEVLDTRIDAVESLAEKLNTAIDSIEATQNEMNNSLDDMDGTLSALADNVSFIDSKLDEVNEKVEALRIPTKTSELENDTQYVTSSELESKGYITEHQDLSSYAKKSDIPDVSQFVTKEYVDSIVENINTEVININQTLQENYVTTNQVNELVTTEVTTVVEEKIETTVTEVIDQKIEDGNIVVNTDAINYGDFEDDII